MILNGQVLTHRIAKWPRASDAMYTTKQNKNKTSEAISGGFVWGVAAVPPRWLRCWDVGRHTRQPLGVCLEPYSLSERTAGCRIESTVRHSAPTRARPRAWR